MKNCLQILLFLMLCSVSFAGGNFFRKTEGKPPEEPTLFLILPDANTFQRLPVVPDPNKAYPRLKNKIVIATHGWYEKSIWPAELAAAVTEKIDPNQWSCGWFDWRKQARVLNPTDAARYAEKTAAPILAKAILANTSQIEHIHLIAHSAASWLITETAKKIAEDPNITIHLTFLDAYVPPAWDPNGLGLTRRGDKYWAEHYFVRDITFTTTQRILPNACNIDISAVTPGINDHEFPRYWYHATVTAQYPSHWFYKNKTPLYKQDGIEYGFALSLEAGHDNWRKNKNLRLGQIIKITAQDKK